MLVELSTAISTLDKTTSAVVVGTLLVTCGTAVIVELMSELEDDARHLPLTSISAFFGTVAFWAGRVNVHSFNSLMFWTPRRDSLR